jgi:phenylpyruvate tautomerase PptA (4-oxalocrotonate tautomerase family)
MPIVSVTALTAPDDVVTATLVAVVADVADALGCDSGEVWAHFVPAGAQHVGERAASPDEQCPVVVIRGRARSDESIGAALGAAAQAVSHALGVPPEDVWVHWVDVAPGRAHAGGALLGPD